MISQVLLIYVKYISQLMREESEGGEWVLWKGNQLERCHCERDDLLTLPDDIIEFKKFHMQLGNNKKAISDRAKELSHSDMCSVMLRWPLSIQFAIEESERVGCDQFPTVTDYFSLSRCVVKWREKFFTQRAASSIKLYDFSRKYSQWHGSTWVCCALFLPCNRPPNYSPDNVYKFHYISSSVSFFYEVSPSFGSDPEKIFIERKQAWTGIVCSSL